MKGKRVPSETKTPTEKVEEVRRFAEAYKALGCSGAGKAAVAIGITGSPGSVKVRAHRLLRRAVAAGLVPPRKRGEGSVPPELLERFADEFLANGANADGAARAVGATRRGGELLQRARRTGVMQERLGQLDGVMSAQEAVSALTALARGETEEQRRLHVLGVVADLSRYVQQVEIKKEAGEDGKVDRILLGLDIVALQNDGLGHLIREVQDDAVKFHDPVPPNVALLRSRKDAIDSLARIHGIDHGDRDAGLVVNGNVLLQLFASAPRPLARVEARKLLSGTPA
jgi:hypothetical protein